MTLKKGFMALVMGLITLVAQAAAFDPQLELAATYDNQVIQYYQQGRFEQALPLAEKVLKIRTEVLGEKHAYTLMSLNNLAMLYQNLGRLSEALPLFETGYRLSKDTLGEKHRQTLTGLNNLALCYNNLGRLKEALPLLETGYRLRQEVLGKKHPDTLTTLNNLALVYQNLGHLNKALPLFEKSYRLRAEVLGEKHPDYRYLVFSTHGYLSTEVPALSSIVLGQVNNPPGIDGYVTAGEWAGYNLKSDLMVLSACETGVGEVISGEGVMGLPYAFYVAGNKNTLLTLWSISDEVTAKFIYSFFRKLKKGVGQIEALTATKREFIKKGGRYSDPMYWAAFVLYGV